MGDRNKLLLDVGGRPMVRRVAETLLASRVREVIAVLGYDRARVAAALAGLPLRIVVNDEYASGQMSSVRAGIAAIMAPPRPSWSRSPTSPRSSRRISTS